MGAFSSDDGHEWEPAEGFELVETGRDGAEWQWQSGEGLSGVGDPADSHLAAGPRGFVAVFNRGLDVGTVAFSADGSSWDRIELDDLPATDGAVTNVVAGTDGFVMAGKGEDVPGDTGDAFVWFSADGRTWQTTDLPRHKITLDVAHNGSEWMVFVDLTGLVEDTPRVFTSADGLQWAEVASENVPPDNAFWSYYPDRPRFSSPFAAAGDTWVLIGSKPPVAWVSTDNGRSWDETEIAADPPLSPTTYITDITHTEYGFLATGSQRDSDSRPVLLVSEDAMEWETVTAVSDHLGLEALAGDIIANDSQGTIYIWRQ